MFSQDKVKITLGSAMVAIGLSVATIFAQVQSGNLNPLNNSGVQGTYRFEAVNENQTRVTVNLQGLEADSTHAGHFHQGTCNNIGSVTISLNDIQADGDGRGSMTTTVNSSLQNIYSGNYLIAYHESDANSDSIVCSTIPARTINETGTLSPLPAEAPLTGLGGMFK
jgi:hypothetical protein